VVVGDAMSGLVEASELLDVQVQQVARSISFAAADRLWRCEPAEAVQTPNLESMSHSGPWEAKHFTDLVRRKPQLAQSDDQVPPTNH